MNSSNIDPLAAPAQGDVETISDLESFRRMGPEWDELLKASDSDSLFLTWEWLFTWWKHLAGRRALSILTVRSEGRLIAVAPLALRPRELGRLMPFGALEFLGTGSAGSDYLDVIIRAGFERLALAALADHLSLGRTMLDFAQVKKSGSPAVDLAGRIEGRGWSLARSTTAICPYIDLANRTWDSYLKELSSAHRYNLQRRIRNLSRSSDLQFIEANSDDERREFLGHLVDLHMMRWRQRGGSQAFNRSALIEFHDDFSAVARARGWLRLFLLRSGTKPVAALYGFRYGGTFYFYQAGFHPAHAKQSVGLVAMALTIQRALEEGVREFDLLHGDESYKFLWTRQYREIDRLEIYPPRARGAIHRGANGFGRGARRLARRALPRALADRIAAVLESRREDHTCLEVS